MTDFIVLFNDVHDRPTHGVTDDPIGFLAGRMVEGRMTSRQLDDAKIFTLGAMRPVSAEVKAVAATIKRAEEARLSQGAFHRKVTKGQVSPEDVEAIRETLRQRHPDENYDPPWPGASR